MGRRFAPQQSIEAGWNVLNRGARRALSSVLVLDGLRHKPLADLAHSLPCSAGKVAKKESLIFRQGRLAARSGSPPIPARPA